MLLSGEDAQVKVERETEIFAMNPAYSETRFITPAAIQQWPNEFAILSAYSTTGEVWSADQNEKADQKLQAELGLTNVWLWKYLSMLRATTAFASSRTRFIMLRETPFGLVTAITGGR